MKSRHRSTQHAARCARRPLRCACCMLATPAHAAVEAHRGRHLYRQRFPSDSPTESIRVLGRSRRIGLGAGGRSLASHDRATARSLSARSRPRPVIPTPRWQSLGKINLAKGSPLKIVVANDEPERRSASPQRRCPRFCGSLPAEDSTAAAVARPGPRPRRLDRAEPRHPPQPLSDQQRRRRIFKRLPPPPPGATAPSTSASRCWSRSGFGRCSPRRRSTPRSPASSTATITRSRKSCSRRFPASP